MNGLVNAKKWHGARVRTLPSHCCGLSLIPTPEVTCGLSLLLVPLLVMWVFPQVLGVSSLCKNLHPNFQFASETVDRKSHLVECSLLNYYYYYYYYCYYYCVDY